MCIWVGVLIVWPAVGHAATAQERESLREFTGMGVIVEDLSTYAQQAGLTKAHIVTDVEVRLRQAGIKVLTRRERLRTPGQPYLYVRVTAISIPSNTPPSVLGYAFAVDVHLEQRVNLSRNRQETDAKTWSTVSIGVTPPRGFARIARQAVRDLLDEFLNDYLAVNPDVANRAPPLTSSLRDLTLRAQEHLKASGYQPGPVDGILGDRTRQALRQYQADNELPVTGELDDTTKKAMGLEE